MTGVERRIRPLEREGAGPVRRPDSVFDRSEPVAKVADKGFGPCRRARHLADPEHTAQHLVDRPRVQRDDLRLASQHLESVVHVAGRDGADRAQVLRQNDVRSQLADRGGVEAVDGISAHDALATPGGPPLPARSPLEETNWTRRASSVLPEASRTRGSRPPDRLRDRVSRRSLWRKEAGKECANPASVQRGRCSVPRPGVTKRTFPGSWTSVVCQAPRGLMVASPGDNRTLRSDPSISWIDRDRVQRSRRRPRPPQDDAPRTTSLRRSPRRGRADPRRRRPHDRPRTGLRNSAVHSKSSNGIAVDPRPRCTNVEERSNAGPLTISLWHKSSHA